MYENDGHVYRAKIFSNPELRNRMGIMLGGGNIFGIEQYDRIRHDISETELGSLCEEEGIKTKELINGILGTVITDVEYGKLRDCRAGINWTQVA
jgi:hypothetical protein